MHFTEYHTRLAAYALIVDENERILLTWFNGNDRNEPCWSLPGGGVEYDETVEDGVVREVLEETGYQVVLGDPLTVHSFTAPGEPDRPLPYKSVRIVYRGTITGGTLGTLEIGGTTDFAEWKSLDLEGPRADIVDVAIAAWRSHRAR
ncbi:NUDIX domain-containing protein [Kribbella italica]|uniref:ADP-ribose pyrophosphatase YjhB (NUDIX family) n=1 Tax=Kribbella italica TaxID=1540520 RepID=A0A7W9J889_9ACTN|nr:ADP-ribose pyrophosphatase YjhB (NUDIX family) [Kribbella italica]